MILPFIISGLVTGSVYGLTSVGLVLTYKTSGVFNFAHGALATISAYLFYALYIKSGLSWPVSAAICVFVAGPIVAIGFERLAKVLTGRSLAIAVTSTVGVVLIVQAAALLIYPQTETRTVPVFLAHGQFDLFGTAVQYSDLITFLFAALSTIALYVFFRVSRTGAAMRAVVDAPDLLEISGTSATGVRRWAWLIGVCFASASGVLLSTLLQLDPIILTLLVVQAFGAAALGAFRSLPLTFLGGLLIGVLASLCTKWFTTGILAGLSSALPFVVLFAVLMLFPKKYLTERSRLLPTVRSSWTTPAPIQLVGGAALLVFLAIVPTFAGVHLTDWTVAVGTIILFLSLGLLVRTSGQVSLCHVTFMAIGVVTFAHTSADWNLPWAVAFLLAMAICVPIGALLAIPAIRLSPLYLALATLGFGLFVQYMFYTQDFMFGSTQDGLPVPRPSWLGLDSDKGFYYLVLVLAVVVSVLLIGLNRGRFGRLLRAMAESSVAVETSGSAVKITRVLVFCLSAALAAGAGVLIAAAQETASIVSYPPLLSLTYIVLVVIVVGGTPWFAVIAALSWVIPPAYISSDDTAQWLQILFGLFAIGYAFTPDSARGVPAWLRNGLDARFRRGGAAATPHVVTDAPAPTAPVPPIADAAGGALEVEGITMRFGGLVAVHGVSLAAPTGRITGVIGPNGAGKSTTFNICSGLLSATEGTVRLDGVDVTRRSADARARRGVGRTFQQLELFESLSVWDNVAMGTEGGMAGANPLRHLVARPADADAVTRAVVEALEICGIGELADTPVSMLSTGQRRLVELARCVAGPFRILLLDEPSSGLDHEETARFGAILKRLSRERGIGILLVEHDMSLVMDVCEHIYVLDFGELIFEGTPDEILTSETVQSAYLGFAEADEEPAVVAGAQETTP